MRRRKKIVSEVILHKHPLKKKQLLCSKCSIYEETVDEDVIEVICWHCCVIMGGPPPETKKSEQTGPHRPKGWKFMKVYVDSEQNVFHKGIEQPELKGTLTPTIEKPKKSKFQKEQEKVEKEQRLAERHMKKMEKVKLAEEKKQQKLDEIMDDTKE